MIRLRLAAPALAALVVASPASAATCADTNLRLSKSTRERVEAAVVCLVNEERAKAGRKAFKVAKPLRKAARAHTKDMAKRGYFDHVSPGGSTPIQRARKAGYKGNRIGENIANGPSTAKAALELWMRSAEHRTNIRSADFNVIGVGATAAGGNLYTQVFGKV